MTLNESVRLAKTAAMAAFCPITEANLGGGLFDAPEWLDAGGITAIGSGRNISISVAEEIRLLE